MATDVIEVHAHVIPEGVLGKAGPHGPEMAQRQDGGYTLRAGKASLNATTVAHQRHERGEEGGEEPSEWLDRLSNPERRVREMDEKGIDMMVVSPAPPLYLYDIEPEYAVPFSGVYNDELADFCATASDRLFFMATLPLQDLDAAVQETKRAASELHARGVYIGASDLAGRELDDPDFWPLYEAIVASGLPLSIHPYPTLFGSGDVDCYHQKLSLGFPAQETHAIFRLIAGGVFDAFPDLKVYVSHGGGFFPFQIGRIDTFLSIAHDSKAEKPVSDYLERLYFDFILHDAKARQLLVDVMGASQVLHGSNYAGMDSVDGLSYIADLQLPDDERDQIMGGNAKMLFNLPG